MDGIKVSQPTIMDGGASEGNRTYALFDTQKRFINGITGLC